MENKQQTERIYDLFNEYREAYLAEWDRQDKCERLYRGEHWYGVPERDRNEPRPVTPVIQSTIESVRADLIDQSPEAVITADDPKHRHVADLLTAAVRENHIRTDYSGEFAKLTHDLLVCGYMVQETGFDPALSRGMGGAFIRHVDCRSIMFDPLATQVSDCRAIFKFVPYPKEWFEKHYPDKAVNMQSDIYTVRPLRDGVLMPRDSDCILLIECWQREFDESAGRYAVHMQKYAGGQLLEDSRTVKPSGYFAHGEYPFTVTALYPRKGSILGFGYVDMFETQQRYSDRLDQIVMKNALLASRNKLLVTGASGFDPDDLRDWAKEVHRGENLSGVTWFPTAPLPAYILEYIKSVRDGIKEESGANDFSRGMTAGGVTAASAIAALQEMSSKRSRMVSRSVHGAFEAAVRQEIEVEREFAVFSRPVRVESGLERFNSDMMSAVSALGNELPIEFSVSVKSQRENRFSVTAHNELMLSLVKMNMLAPDAALELMIFDGKEQALSLMRKKAEQAQAVEQPQFAQNE